MPRVPMPPRSQRGFTLTELFAVVAVAAVLAAAALPNLQDFIKNNNRSTRINTLVTALNYARSDAVTQRRTTTVCPSTNQCSCAANNQYHSGVLVRIGTGTAGTPCPSPPIRVFKMDTSANFTLLGTSPGAAPRPPLNLVAFGPTGRAAGNVANSTFVYCDDRGAEHARAIILSATGHPKTTGESLSCP